MIGYQGQCVVVLGLGASGLAAAHYLVKRGALVAGLDRHPEKVIENPKGKTLVGPAFSIHSDQDLLTLTQADFMVLSPGIPLTHPICQKAQALGLPIIGEVELGCRDMKQRAIGVTGTNGKTTVSLLIVHVLQTAGIAAQVVGNIDKFFGKPLTEALDSSFEGVYVIELSSYQLETLRLPVLDAGLILNITPDHLDRYGTMEAYAKAKAGIQYCLKSTGSLWIEESCYQEWSSFFSSNQKKPSTYGFNSENDLIYAEKIEYFLAEEYRGRRDHNIANLMAAFAATRSFGVSEEVFARAVATFCRPAHRIEFVREREHVSYYNDSKGTNLDAVVKAVESMQAQVILVAGGLDKGAPYTTWIEEFKGKVEFIYAIGQAAAKIRQDIGHAIPVEVCGSLEEAVGAAASAAKPGMCVLLSPGCASYDMFKDYAHRGEEFKRIVNSLPQRCLGGIQSL